MILGSFFKDVMVQSKMISEMEKVKKEATEMRKS